MLEVLTESEMSDGSKERVAKILREQREALRLAMARPQVQFVLYETHSTVDTENSHMIEMAIESSNRSSQAKHIKMYRERKRLEALAEQEGLNAEQLEKLQGISSIRKKGKEKSKSRTDQSSSDEEDSDGSSRDTSLSFGTDDDYAHIKVRALLWQLLEVNRLKTASLQVPKTDLFEQIAVPDVCKYQNDCLNLKSIGCYLSLLKRRTVTRLNEKHLILMAERRGLFGEADWRTDKNRAPPKKEEKMVALPKAKAKKLDDISVLVIHASPFATLR